MKRLISQSALVIALGGEIAFGVFALNENRIAKDLVVHEWGTFTSIQGSDGVPLYWESRDVAPLPSFVYNWKKPALPAGWNRSPGVFGKQSAPMMVQRMETPVVYFYSPREQTVDLQVEFPKGQMTEWYPHAAEVGPSYSTNQQAQAITKHLVHWPEVQVLADAKAVTLPNDELGSHYYAARATDSALLRVASPSTNNAGEYEKFLFYRGVGNFKTPLTASMSAAATVDLGNTGPETLHDLFVLDVHRGQARLVHLKSLRPKEQRHVELQTSTEPLNAVSDRLSTEMVDALVRQKLFPREAAAMVKTWKDSWFEEEGIRVLYLLPRKWTDAILPMSINPQPHDLVRVMVGRAELISPALEKTLADEMVGVSKGDFASKVQLHQQLATAGRFANPLLSRAFEVAQKINGNAVTWTDVCQKIAQLKATGLIFDFDKKDYTAKVGEAEAHFTFKIANLSAKELVVERAQGSCGCTYAKLPAQPWHLRSGEVADLPVTMILKGKPPGEITKDVILFTSEGQHKLTVRTVVPAPEPVKTAALTQ